MLGVETRIPVHLRKIEAENAIFCFYFHVQVGIAGQELVAEGTIFTGRADVVDFVDHGADGGVFVNQNGRD